MKKRTGLALIILAALVTIIPACEKDDDNTTPKTKTELITQASWKFSSLTVAGINANAFVDDCQKDNTFTFASNGTGIMDEGPTKCDPADPQTSNFTWAFQANETQLFVSAPLFAGGSSSFQIQGLTETQLILSQQIDFNGSMQDAVITLVH